MNSRGLVLGVESLGRLRPEPETHVPYACGGSSVSTEQQDFGGSNPPQPTNHFLNRNMENLKRDGKEDE